MTVNLVLQNTNSPYNHYATTPYPHGRLAAVHHQRAGERHRRHPADVPGVSNGRLLVDDVAFTDSPAIRVSGGVPWPQATFGTLRLWTPHFLDLARAPERLLVLGAARHLGGRGPGARCERHFADAGPIAVWASSNPDLVNYIGPGAPARPPTYRNWRDYITAVAQRYKGSIRYYEIWNEPNDPTYYSGTVAQLAQLTQEAYSIINPWIRVTRSVHRRPTCRVPRSTPPGGHRIERGCHRLPFYETPPELTAAAMANVRLVLAKNNVSSIPLWDTEGASGDTATPPDWPPPTSSASISPIWPSVRPL